MGLVHKVVRAGIEERVHDGREIADLVSDFADRRQQRIELGAVDVVQLTWVGGAAEVPSLSKRLVAVRHRQHVSDDLMNGPVQTGHARVRVRGADQPVEAISRPPDAIP